MDDLPVEQALLIWQEEELIKEQWVLDADEILIGRGAECQISIPARWVSRHHARLRWEAGQYVLEDLGSKNGVFVNGQRVVRPRPLRDGDRIQLAPGIDLTFVDSEATAPLPGRSGMGLRVDTDERQVYVRGQLLSPPLSTQQYEVLVLLASQPGKVFSRADIIAAAWPDAAAEGVSDDAIDALIRRLRHRLAELEPVHDYIVTVRGYGFRLDNEPE